MNTVFALLSALSYGTSDFFGGLASRKSSPLTVLLWSQITGLLLAFSAVFLLQIKFPENITVIYAAAAGLCGAAGLAFLYKGLSSGPAAVVAPVSAVTGAALPVLFGVFIRLEHPSAVVWTGIITALPAIFFLTYEKTTFSTGALKSLITGITAGLFFGCFYIFISFSSSGNLIWTMVFARSASVPVLLLISAAGKIKIIPPAGNRVNTAIVGFLDMGANLLFLLALSKGSLVTATVITSLYPAPTVIIQTIVYKEKISFLRFTGIILALAGAILISLG